MKKFCTCGAITNYDLKEPNFCSGCGQTFGAAAPVVRQQPAVARQRPVLKPQYDDEDEDEGVQGGAQSFDISKLDMEITLTDQIARIPASAIMRGTSDSTPPSEGPKPKPLSKKAHANQLKEFLSRQKNPAKGTSKDV